MKTERINLSEELFKSWLEDETNKVEAMTTVEEIQAHIMMLEQIVFEQKTRLSVAHQKRIKLQGPNWAENSKAISDPTFKVNYDKDPREKKESKPKAPKLSKEEKQNKLMESAGVNVNALKEAIKRKMAAKALENSLKKG